MLRTVSTIAFSLLAATAMAQDAANTGTNPAVTQENAATADDKATRDAAAKNAETAGLKDVTVLDRAFVLQGTNAAGNPVFLIVDPPGVLVGIGGPLDASDNAADGTASTTTTSDAGTSESVAEKAGEPAKSGYMATQAQPATPGMWDPEGVERRMKEMGLDKPTN